MDSPTTCLTSALRAHRIENGWTLVDLEGLTGYSESMFSRVERGEREFSAAAKVHIARCLGVQVSDLFDVPAPPAVPDAA